MSESYVVKTRCGSDTYVKPDGKIGTAGKGALIGEELSFTLSASSDQTLVQPDDYIVRRLTPTECNRLQGFPDEFDDLAGCNADAVTDAVADSLGYEGGSEKREKLHKNVSRWSKSTPDSRRYKAMGNSMAVPTIAWLGKRIEAFDVLHYDEIGLDGLDGLGEKGE